VKRILVVDDNPAVREVLTDLLRGHYHVAVAGNGAEALDALQERLPDGILLDLAMPVMDGWTFLERRRDDPAIAEVPVLILSAECPDRPKAEPPDVQDYVAKPFDVEHLLSAVERLVTPTGGTDVVRAS
jgi:CheY-like chemotaxis protein